MAETTLPDVKIWIGHKGLSSGSGGTHAHLNPVTGEKQADIPLAGKAEVDQAVETAAEAFKTWRMTRPEQRRDILNKFAELIDQHKDEFAALAAKDGGTPLMGGMGMAMLSVQWTKYYAGWCDKLDGDLYSTYDTRGEFAYSVPEPLGVVGIIITWNGPLISLSMKVAPALAAGNCVVVKPAEITPFAPDLYARLAKKAGIPDGVLSIIPGGIEAGEALVTHPKIEKLSFTGGPIAARKIMAACAENIKPSVMELGGKSASLMFPDADIDAACARAIQWSIGVMAGQGCALPTRLLVHKDIYAEVCEKLVAIASQYKVGDPFEEGVTVGPVINRAACDRIVGMLDRAKAEKSGRILMGGNHCGGKLANGNFVEPTIIADVDPRSEIAQIEIFGPVLLVFKFETEDEAVALANDTEYGLAAYIQSNDIKRIHRVAERLKAGGVYVNGAVQINPHTPFGGLGLSGFGKEGGRAGIDEFLRYKTVAIA
ncbi:aldehyde dehydrogenase family protein [Hyphomonas oceanitis]|uniref:Aldehyde dehydrogenase n=1 Tax=Hyphomonas oceanitis SCH89 TaxID=1280953 RepID=A0A059G569_9PROT|nr:aldehyde dehydrogenase family protein [Hyphomonas oceanitis]KDA01740.1 aldehyde dehydrogenase [Hyphomonas oceanitis SCH89]